jgi:hypothetical protein
MAAAAAAVALAAALVESVDTVFPAPSALHLADFFPVPPGLGLANGAAALDDGGAQQMHEQWAQPLQHQQ